ncbi:hypothetical protein L6164_003032 [Bauhinia variegata]|uniref:Uncharacterized protein n=1 Tax=Bauhinia variegata TaxID=167791 RepID=A0ACB9Q202_BAUVA|nr:hypothetical protein L6164_003032 [Bauhinia variegata]
MEAFAKNLVGKDTFTMVTNCSVRDCLLKIDKDCEAIRIDLANWDNLKAKSKLQQDMKAYRTAQGEIRIASIIKRLYEPEVKHELSNSVGDFLCKEADPTWSKIRKRLNSVMLSTKNKVNTFRIWHWSRGKERKDSKYRGICKASSGS